MTLVLQKANIIANSIFIKNNDKINEKQAIVITKSFLDVLNLDWPLNVSCTDLKNNTIKRPNPIKPDSTKIDNQ